MTGTNHVYSFRNGWITFPGIMDEPGSTSGRIISEIRFRSRIQEAKVI